MKIHVRIAELRKKNNYTQQQVADYLGISRGAYANYEIGNREPDADALAKLAKLYNTNVDYILGLTDDPSPKTKDENNSPIPSYVQAWLRADTTGLTKDEQEQLARELAEYFEFRRQRILEMKRKQQRD